MRVVLDRHIPFLADALSDWAEVQALEPEQITPEQVKNADALFVRTRTRVDKKLLEHSVVRLVATATIGYDHIDTHYCETHGIHWTACPGCNAQAVCDYVEEALACWAPASAIPLRLGIIGVGHVGERVAQMAKNKGWNVVLNDPPKGMFGDVSDCDVITFHTPLIHDGKYPTFHMADAAFLQKLKPDAILINAARGGVVDEQALLQSGHRCVVDCWENEPHLNLQLLMSRQTLGATYHIAGYSLQGKWNASQKCLDVWRKMNQLPPAQLPKLTTDHGDSATGWIQRITNQLRKHPDMFEQLRQTYPLR